MNNPWIGVLLVGLGLVAIVVFTILHVDQVPIAAGVVMLGVSIIQAQAHVNTKQELTQLRASIRPPSSPDLSHLAQEVATKFPPQEEDTKRISRMLDRRNRD